MTQLEVESTTDQDDLGDELFQVRRHTLDRDRVRGKISAVEDHDETIVVRYEILTTGEEGGERFEKPKTWSRSNRFVRLVEWCGYNSASALQLEGEEIPLQDDGTDDSDVDGDWRIDIDRLPGEGLLNRADYYNGVFNGAVAALFVVGAISAPSLLGFSLPVLSSTMLGLGLGLVSLPFAIKWVYLPPDDDREPVSYSELGVGLDE